MDLVHLRRVSTCISYSIGTVAVDDFATMPSVLEEVNIGLIVLKILFFF